MAMTPQDFYAQFLPYAQSVSQRTGLDPRLVLAQAALETGYGRSAPGQNYFGIKSHGRAGGNTLQTQEFEGGRMVSQPASFRGYESPEQSFNDYADFLLTNPRYGGVLSASGIENQIAEMAKSGYATDPNYGAKLANIAGKFDPNAPPIIAAQTMQALGRGGDASGSNGGGAMPRGLLPMDQEPQTFGQRFKADLKSGDFMDRLALAANSLRMNPDANLAAAIEGRQERRETAAQKNATAEWLRSRGRDDLADAMQAGLPAAEALQMAMQPAPQAEMPTPQSAIAKLEADRRAGLISEEQYQAALTAMAPAGMSVSVGPDGQVQFTQGPGAATAKPFTEGQSKDVVYATRAQGALQVLEPVAEELTSLGSKLAGSDPTGIIRGRVQSPEYQVARNAGDEFLQAILRKDTGAAITSQEQALYGETYLPQPGDGPEVLEAKRAARQRAVAAINAGMSPAQMIAQEKALMDTGTATAPQSGPAKISNDAEYEALPSGTQFIGPDGKLRRKP